MALPMIAAVYARKSTDQSGVADDQKSVARQVEHARAYAMRKGWTVDEAHVYVDDGISGAEFANRPGYLRLMNALRPRAPFAALIMSEVSRLGREQIETAYALKQLSVAGVRCFSYLEDRELLMESATDKFLLGAVTFAADLEREKARQRVHDAMLRKARAGHATGAACFGYTNVVITDAAGRRSHVERQINDIEAEVVRTIFTLCASGVGYTRIAKQLNARRAAAPRPKPGRVFGWAPTSVKEILDRRLYLGEISWNKTQKRNQWGAAQQHDRPETDWVQTVNPALRIVSDALWHAAHGRLESIRAGLVRASGGRVGVRRRDVDSHYLLAGFARCAVCGGTLGVISGSHQTARGHVYGCFSYLKRGTSVCGNGLRLPLDRIDDAVLGKLAGEVLRPPVVMAVIDGVFEQMTPRAREQDLEQNRALLRTVDHGISNLAQAIATAGDLGPLLHELRVARAKRDELTAAIGALEHVDVGRFDRSAIERQVLEHLRTWQSLLSTKRVEDGRQLLREVLVGPLRFTPEGRKYRFDGDAAVGGLLARIAGVAPFMVAVHRSVEGCIVQFTGTAA